MAKTEKNRAARLAKIKKAISQNKIRSQGELLEILKRDGVDITQATLSRDLRTLKIGKTPGDDGRYFYIVPEIAEGQSRLAVDFLRGFKSVAVSKNMAVIKTESGFTDVVSTALDVLLKDEILGTIAGNDNCVMACLREETTKGQFFAALKAAIPQLEIGG